MKAKVVREKKTKFYVGYFLELVSFIKIQKKKKG